MYQIYKFKLHDQSHVIYRLGVHVKDEQYVYFKHGSEKKMINKNLGTTLTAWFDLNKVDFNAKQYLYNEIPNHYVFDKISKTWNQRKKLWKPVLSKIYFVSPKDRERFYLRLNLLHVRGAMCFEDLRTVDNKIFPTFYEAAIAEWVDSGQKSVDAAFLNRFQ